MKHAQCMNSLRTTDNSFTCQLSLAVAFEMHRHFGTKRINAVEKRNLMLKWTIIFLVVALVAAVLGFAALAGTAAAIAKVLFLIFIVLFLVSLIRRNA